MVLPSTKRAVVPWGLKIKPYPLPAVPQLTCHRRKTRTLIDARRVGREAPFLVSLMSALIFFIPQIPNLLGTSSHMPWNHRLKFFRSTYAFYVNKEQKEKERKALPGKVTQPQASTSVVESKLSTKVK